jgi:peptidyl-prolyl cis-trans isomerase SurA
MMRIRHIFLVTSVLIGVTINAQVIDKVTAVVGDYIIKESDIEQQYLQMRASGYRGSSEKLKCQIYEDLLSQKLFYNQAKVDSIEVGASEVELQLQNRIDYFIDQIGSEQALEEYFNKSIYEIKDEFRGLIEEQISVERMQQEIIGEVNVTPEEVKNYYESVPKDSLPRIEETVTYRQVLLYPPQNEEAIFAVRERLLELRKRILEGESFKTLAVLYSEGPSAPNGGEIGYLSKGQLDPAYAEAAFNLKRGGVSRIVESDFGYHIIQLIDKKNDKVNTRHILMKPKVTPREAIKAKQKLDSIANLIRKDSLDFEVAANRFSEDKNTRIGGGLVFDPMSGESQFKYGDLPAADLYVIKNMKPSEVSDAFESKDDKNKTVFKIIQLIEKQPPHRANIMDDFNAIKDMATSRKKQEILNNWITEKIRTTYIEIDDDYLKCKFNHNWLK